MEKNLYNKAQIHLQQSLYNDPLFDHSEEMIAKMIVLEDEGKIIFTDDIGGKLVQDAFFKIIDELTAFIGCCKQGAFYGSLHHLRALIELYVNLKYNFKNKENTESALKRYDQFPKLWLHLRFLEIENGENPYGFTEEQKKDIRKNHSSLNDEILQTFNFKDIEKAQKRLLTNSSWNIVRFDKLFEAVDKTHAINYEKFCFYSHFSPQIHRANRKLFSINPRKSFGEELAAATLYAYQCYSLLNATNYINNVSKKLIMNIWEQFLPVLNKSLKEKNQML